MRPPGTARVKQSALEAWGRTPEGVRAAVRRLPVFSRGQRWAWRTSPDDVVFVPVVGATGADDDGAGRPRSGRRAPEPVRRRVLVLDLDLPQPTRSGGHRRLLELVRLLRDDGYDVTLGASNTLATTSMSWGVPLPVLQQEHARLAQEFPVLVGPADVGEHLNARGPQLAAVVFSRTGPALHHLHHVLSSAPRARIVFDSMDAEHARKLRQVEVETGEASLQGALQSVLDESLMLDVSDAVIAVTEQDRQALARLRKAPGETPVVVLSNIYDLSTRRPHGDRSSAAWDLLFVGGYLHPPNVDAVRWFLAEVAPLLPGRRTALVGHGLPPRLVEQALAAGVSYLGEVADLEQLYADSRLSIAPLRYGAGVKGKVVEAALHGLPVVGTSVAWEGIDVDPGRSGAVADDAKAFAGEVERLLGHPEVRSDVVEASLEWLSRFGRDRCGEVLREVMGEQRAAAS